MLTSIFSFLKLRHDVAAQAPARVVVLQPDTNAASQSDVDAAGAEEENDDTFARPMVFPDSLFDWPGP